MKKLILLVLVLAACSKSSTDSLTCTVASVIKEPDGSDHSYLICKDGKGRIVTFNTYETYRAGSKVTVDLSIKEGG